MKDTNFTKIIILPLDDIEVNEGQLEGLPSNPRSITREKMELLKTNITDYPEMLSLRSLLIYPIDDSKYILIGGNMRYRALKELGYTEAPCIIIPKETSIEQLKAYTIIDNNGFGKWSWDMLANEWDELQLVEWGVDLPIIPTGEEPNTNGEIGDENNDTEKLTFTLAKEQAAFIKAQLKIAQYNDSDTFGNTNDSGNALYSIVKQWAEIS
nr:MAG TPA: ParB protein [Caudoviricetes sp.]